MIGEDVSSGMPHHGCSGMYSLNNKAGVDMLAGGQQIIIDRECNEAVMGAKYDGNFEYQCNEISYNEAMTMFEDSKIKEQLQNSKNSEVFENNEEVDVETATQNINPNNDTTNRGQNIQNAFDQMKLDMDASQTDH